MPPDPILARKIVETLAQHGTPIPQGVSYYNVGNESLLDVLDNHYLATYLPDGGAVFKLVVGPYGSGKSHFLYCVQDRAWARNFAVSRVDLSPKETPFSDQKKVYAAVATAVIRNKPDGPDEEDRGFAAFIEATLARLTAQHRFDVRDPEAATLPEIVALRETLIRTRIDSPSYKQAVIGYVDALTHNNDIRQQALARWLNGDAVTVDDMRVMREIGVTERITKDNAFRMLRSFTQTIRALGYSGTLLMFDEGDRMMSMTKTAMKSSADNLREVIDRCRDDLPSTMFLYTVPPDFVTDVINDYEALKQRVQAPPYFSRRNPFSPQISLDQLDLSEEELLRQIGGRLLPIFEIAFRMQLTPDIQNHNISALAKAALTSMVTINARRLFVRALMSEWYRQMTEGESVLSPTQADQILMGSFNSIEAATSDQSPSDDAA